ncbi:DUF4382 domain-containing protein [Salinibaculum salinum]|uniref:DUF4382 domain-containing protein n=1 Tax=Salinibaculum salinum TaxID=3131996 RepID=UPI0030EF89B4
MRHTETETQTNRRAYLKSVGAVSAVGMVGLSGCAGSGNDTTGTLATEVTDQPGDIADFESCIVTIAGIWVKPSVDDETEGSDDTEDGVTEQTEEDVDESDDRQYYQFEEPQEADLVELQDGNTKLIDERELPTQTYGFLQLDVTGVAGTLDGGEEATVETPGNAPLQFKEEFEIRADESTTFVGDFTPVKRGQTNGYLLQPVASGTEVRYEGE